MQAITFIVKNIDPQKRTLKIFTQPIGWGNTYDLLSIPGVSELDIRNSLLDGDLKNKINNKQITLMSGIDVISEDISNDILNIIGPSTLIRPIPVIPGIIKDLTNNQPTSLLQIDLSQTAVPYKNIIDWSWSGKLFFAVECTDGYDVQIREGDVNLAAVMRATGTGSIINAQAVNATNAVTSGTLTTTFSWSTSGTIATLQITPSSSLSPIDLEIHYHLLHATHRAPSFTFL